jgi:hypothetical protein
MWVIPDYVYNVCEFFQNFWKVFFTLNSWKTETPMRGK